MDIDQIIVAVGAVCAAIVALGGAISVIRKWVSPVLSIMDSVEKLKERLDSVEENDRDTREGIGVVCRCLLALMDNAITGNSVDNIKNARREMQEYLIRRP